ncbi:unnamed protein product [Leptosia nina]|uniref:Uncharacterized protein n=1 Tax=Leptosia nina TaxID=320188 RepID=A0AAV1JDG7_9NEOP
MSSNYETKDSATPLAETNVKNVTESSKDAPSSEATSGCIDNDPVSHSQNTQDLPKFSISGQGNSKVSVQNSENEDEFDDPNLDDDEMVTVTNLLANEIELLNKLEEDEEVSILGQRNNSKSDDISSNNPDEVIDLNDSGSINIGVDNELDESKLLMDTDEEMVNDTEQPFDSTDQIESPKRTLKDPNIMLEIPVDLDLSDDDCPLRESWNIFNKKSKSSPDNIAVIDNNIHKGDSSNNVESLLHKSVKDEELTLDHEVPIPKKEKPLVVEVIELLEDDDITEPEDIPKKKLLSEEEELQNAVQGIEADMREPSVDIITCVSILKDPSENIVQGQESCEIKENIETKCLLEHEHENTYLKDSADVVNDVSNNV